tara:strand:+ start:11253 stop:12359 length:1107 start_codon:yes stop_codon:yes gene_type:complete
MYKIILSTGVSRVVDKALGMIRNYLIANNLSAELADKFYLITSFLEVFSNASTKNEEINSSVNRKNKHKKVNKIIVFMFIFFSSFFSAYQLGGSVELFFIILISLLTYVLYRGIVTIIKFEISPKLSVYFEVIFSLFLLIFLYLAITAIEHEYIYYMYMASSVTVLILIGLLSKFSSALKFPRNPQYDSKFLTLIGLGCAPYLERLLIEGMGESTLTGFVIAYMIVSIPLAIVPTSTLLVVLQKFSTANIKFVVLIQSLLVIVIGGGLYYINYFVELFPYTSIENFSSATLCALMNIVISYFETNFLIYKKTKKILISRKFLVLFLISLIVYVLELESILTFYIIYFLMNVISLLFLISRNKKNEIKA